MDLLKLLETYWPYLIVAVPGLYAVWKQWQAARQVARKDRADLIKIATEAAGAVIEDLRAEIERLKGEVEDLHSELASARREHAEMIAHKDAQITLLQGEKRQLEQQVAALEDFLRRHGIEPPKQGQTYWTMQDGALTPAPTGAAP